MPGNTHRFFHPELCKWHLSRIDLVNVVLFHFIPVDDAFFIDYCIGPGFGIIEVAAVARVVAYRIMFCEITDSKLPNS